jgi:hypothetical protein
MLERLNEIDWGKLCHAYGSARDVPGCLNALLSETGSEREEAFHELFGTIYHQGSVYEATEYAIPFLIEIASDAGYPELESLLILLGCLAPGNLYQQDRPFWEDDCEQACYLAVQGGILFYLSHLSHANPKVRIAASFVLSRFPDKEQDNASVVYNRLQRESEEHVRASLLRCWGMIHEESPQTTSTLLGYASDTKEPLLFRFIAAVILETRFPTSHGETTTPILWDGLLDARDLDAHFSEIVCGSRDSYNVALEHIEKYGPTRPEIIERGFTRLLADIAEDGIERNYRSLILSDLLSIGFPYLHGRQEEYPFLSWLQYFLLRQLTERKDIWKHDIASSLQGRGLPTDYETLRLFARDRANTVSVSPSGL